MKKTKLIIASILFLGISVSCKKEVEPEPTPTNPDTAIAITTLANINVGNHNSTDFGSFINLKTGTIYQLSTNAKAVDNQSLVDLVYYYNQFNENEPYIGAPTTLGSNGAIGGLYDSNPDGINFWTTVNNTEFTAANDISVGDFNAIANLADLKAKWGTLNFGLYYSYHVMSEKIYRFKTVGNKIGLLKINTIVGSSQTIGTMNIDVKIQQ